MSIERRRERKVVTVVFCDLVGFTARAESLDPEDVEEILRPVLVHGLGMSMRAAEALGRDEQARLLGSRTWEALLRERAAEELLAQGHRAEGEAELDRAATFYRGVGATFFLKRAEDLLPRSKTA